MTGEVITNPLKSSEAISTPSKLLRFMGANATGTLGGGSQVKRRRRENRGAAGGEGSGEGCDSDLRYSEVPLKGKNKTLVKILRGRQHS